MKRILQCVLLLWSISLTAQDQNNSFFHKIDQKQNSITRQQASQKIKELLHMSPHEELVLIREESDSYGFRHERFQITFRGVPVEFGTVFVHYDRDGKVQSINGERSALTETLSIKPSISENNAVEFATKHIGATKYIWQAEHLAHTPEGAYPKGELVIYNNTLAYKCKIGAIEPRSSHVVYVSAASGEVLKKHSLRRDIDAKGSASTRYSGTQTITTNKIGAGQYILQDNTRGGGIHTFNMHNSSINIGSATEYINSDTTWNEYNNADHDNDALDAHWGAEMTYDYWLNKRGRKSFDNGTILQYPNGSPIKSYVHFATDFPTAMWDGQTRVLEFGNGGAQYNGKTTLDAVAHEFGHGVNDFTANLTNEYESGALDEGLSDIWGACVENYVNNLGILSTPKSLWWMESENIIGNLPLRSLSNPVQTKNPDTYLGDNWYTGKLDKGGVHTNCTVLGFWFYLIADPSQKSGTNDFGKAYNITGMGIEKAAAIVYQAESNYFTSNTGYYGASRLTIEAAENIYGVGSPEVNIVVSAWDAVGVTNALAGLPNYCVPNVGHAPQVIPWHLKTAFVTEDISPDVPTPDYKFNANKIDLYAGQTFPMEVIYSPHDPKFLKVWLDLNHDGTFSYPSELLAESPLVNNFYQSAMVSPVIPMNAASGFTRLRIVMNTDNNNSPCSDLTMGVIRDYLVNILPNVSGYRIPFSDTQLSQGSGSFISQAEIWDSFGQSTFHNYHDGITSPNPGSSLTGYTDLTKASFTVYAGKYNFKADTPIPYNTIHWAVWIDFNHDKDFDDPGELLNDPTINSMMASFSFQIPLTAAPGLTRMRVRMQWFNALQSPYDYSSLGYGETEDYAININPYPLGMDFQHPIPVGTLASMQSYTNTQNNNPANGFKHDYGQPSDDIFYTFTLTQAASMKIDLCGSGINDSYLHVLNNNHVPLFSNDDNGPLCPGNKSSIYQNLAAGTYYVIVEGFNLNQGDITTHIQNLGGCANSFAEGTHIQSAIPIGDLANCFRDTRSNAACFSNLMGQQSPEIYYKFTLAVAGQVSIHTCYSELADTYIHLLNSSQTEIASNDDNGPWCGASSTRASLNKSLAAGTYYIVVEGYNIQTGYITLNVWNGSSVSNNGVSCPPVFRAPINGLSRTESSTDNVSEKKEKLPLTEITLYPNPTSHTTTLSIPELDQPIAITVHDLFGKPLLTLTSSSPETEIDVSNLPAGIYYLTFQLNYNTISRKIEVMR